MFLWNIIVKFFVIFLPSKCRMKVKYYLLGLFSRLYVRRKAKSVGNSLTCTSSKVVVNKNTIIGDHVNFNGLEINGNGEVKIGSYFHSGKDCLILTTNHNYEGSAIPYDYTFITKPVEISDFVWLGERVIILPGTKIGEGAIIQAGAVVHGEIPPCAIAGGNPAVVFKYRDKEHFYKLKEQGKFN